MLPNIGEPFLTRSSGPFTVSCFSTLVIVGISAKRCELSSPIKFAKNIPRTRQLIAIPAPNATDGICKYLVFLGFFFIVESVNGSEEFITSDSS